MYMAIYCGHLDVGKVIGTAVPAASRPAPGVVRVDAGSGFAHAAIDAGLPMLIEAARTQGIATMTVFNSYNCGVLGQHTEAIAKKGLVALGFTNAPASIAPWGAKKPVVGTNPWSLAVPDGQGGAAFVIDQSASVVAKSEVMKRAKTGEALPTGWALDADGQPTTDSQVALKGTMMPSGGYKGVGSAILVEVMAACLAGATPGIEASTFGTNAGGPPKTGQCFIAINPDTTSGGAFASRMTTVLSALTSEAWRPVAGREEKGRKVCLQSQEASPSTARFTIPPLRLPGAGRDRRAMTGTIGGRRPQTPPSIRSDAPCTRMGAAHPTRLSFLRILLRRARDENWYVTRPIWRIDEDGFGHAVYRD